MSNRAVALAHPPPPGRDWHTYNLAQTREGLLFENLLWDLLQTVDEPEYQGNGRPRLPARDVLFAAITKQYSGLSSRRHQALIEKARDEGFLSSKPHFNAVSKFLRLEGVNEILRGLVQASALPLATLEQQFAVDSTGFACGTYGSYRETRYGPTVKGGERLRKWMKLHAICGILTNIITDAVVTDQYGSDSPMLRELVPATAQRFEMREVSADKAYSGKANHWVIHNVGATPLIPFREGKSKPTKKENGKISSAYNSAPGYPGSAKLWRRAWAYFTLHEDEFYARYHKRSNVEATFSAVKARFGERLKSKDPTAQQNEVLCKVVAWNICVLVRAMHEHGIPADFSS